MAGSPIEYYFNEDIRNQCVHILLDRLPPKLTIKIGGFTVTVAGLGKVAQAIQANRIKTGFFNHKKPYVDSRS